MCVYMCVYMCVCVCVCVCVWLPHNPYPGFATRLKPHAEKYVFYSYHSLLCVCVCVCGVCGWVGGWVGVDVDVFACVCLHACTKTQKVI